VSLGKGTSSIGSRYQRIGEGQQTKKNQCLCSELQTVKISDSAKVKYKYILVGLGHYATNLYTVRIGNSARVKYNYSVDGLVHYATNRKVAG
jgi:hypothetical protein